MSVSCLKTLQISYFGKGSMLGYVHERVGKCMLPANLMAISEIKHHVRSQAVTNIVTMVIIIINTKNCSLSIVLTVTDQKPQKSLKR